MRSTTVSQSQPVPALGTPLHPPSQSVLLKGWTALASLFCKGAGDAEEEKILCSGFRAKHFDFYA